MKYDALFVACNGTRYAQVGVVGEYGGIGGRGVRDERVAETGIG